MVEIDGAPECVVDVLEDGRLLLLLLLLDDELVPG